MTESKSFRNTLVLSLFGSTSSAEKTKVTQQEYQEIAELKAKLQEQLEIIERQKKQLEIYVSKEAQTQQQIAELQQEVACLQSTLQKTLKGSQNMEVEVWEQSPQSKGRVVLRKMIFCLTC
jgi:uncharacterized protein involved in exopolysaccharide biosynthesis